MCARLPAPRVVDSYDLPSCSRDVRSTPMTATRYNVPPSSTLVITVLVPRTSPSKNLLCTARPSRQLLGHRAYTQRPATSENSSYRNFAFPKFLEGSAGLQEVASCLWWNGSKSEDAGLRCSVYKANLCYRRHVRCGSREGTSWPRNAPMRLDYSIGASS